MQTKLYLSEIHERGSIKSAKHSTQIQVLIQMKNLTLQFLKVI